MYSSGEVELRECDMVDGLPPKKYCADPTDADNCHCGYESVLDENLQYMLLYHLFGLLWTTQFLQAITYLTGDDATCSLDTTKCASPCAAG